MKTSNFNQYHTLQVRFTYSIHVEKYIKAWQNIECQIQQNFRFQYYTCMNSYQYWYNKLNFENNKTYNWVSRNVQGVINELIDKACFLHGSSIQVAKLRVIPESTKAINIKR